MPDAAIARAAESVALAVLPSDAVGRGALSTLLCAFSRASEPVLVTDGLGRGVLAVLGVPKPKSFHSGRFHGSVACLARFDSPSETLRQLTVRGSELGPKLGSVLARPGVTVPHRPVVGNDAITAISPSPGSDLPGRDALVGAVSALLRERAGSAPVTLRLTYDCDAEASGHGRVMITGTRKGINRDDAHFAFLTDTVPPGCRLPRRVPAGGAIVAVPGASVDWDAYARSVVIPYVEVHLPRHRRVASDAFAAFRGRLDRLVLGGMRDAGSSEVALYRWLDAGGDVRARLNRRQALAAYPILAHLTDKPELAAAVDAESPLPEALAEATGTSVAAARRLVGIRDTDDGFLRSLVAVLPDTAGVDPRRLPANGGAESVADQWRGLRNVVLGWRTLARQSLTMGLIPASQVRARVAAESPAWQRRGGPAACETMADEAGDVDDFVRGFVRQVLLPLAVDASPIPADACIGFLQCSLGAALADGSSILSASLFRDRDLASLVRMSRTWHARHQVIDAALKLGREAETLSWLPLSAPYRAPCGIELVPLTDPAALAEEGRLLDHCVGSYILECLEEGSHIVSLRLGGRPLSTVQIVLATDDGESPEPRVVQHCGPGNDGPPQNEVAAVAAYLAGIVDGTVPVDAAALEAARKDRVRDLVGGAAARTVGYDHGDAMRRDLALSLYAFALPPDEVGPSHAAWADRLGLPGRLDAAMRAQARDYHRRIDLRRACGDEHVAALEAWLIEPAEAPATRP